MTIRPLKTHHFALRSAAQKRRDAPSISLPQQDADCISHIALDIGGSLIKLVYFSPDAQADPLSPSASSRSGGAFHKRSQLLS